MGEALFKGGRVGLVSRNTGYIYARLRDPYGDKLKDLSSLLLATATVGGCRRTVTFLLVCSEVCSTFNGTLSKKWRK